MSVDSPVIPTADEVGQCLSLPRSSVNTALGMVEYAERGTGTALLSVHGMPGGCHQGLAVADFFRANGFHVIAPSRPGYLNTPLTSGRTPQEQADLLAALLDALSIERTVVFGVSGGGPASYLLAARHPDRVSCLLEFASISMPFAQSAATTFIDRVFMSRLGNRLLLWMLDNRPAMLEALMAPHPGDDAVTWPEDAYGRAVLRTLMATSRQPRIGYENDRVQFANLAPLPLAAISCPSLLTHGTADADVDPAHTEHAAAEIPGAEVHWIEHGTHITAPVEERDKSNRHALDWLSVHSH